MTGLLRYQKPQWQLNFNWLSLDLLLFSFFCKLLLFALILVLRCNFFWLAFQILIWRIFFLLSFFVSIHIYLYLFEKKFVKYADKLGEFGKFGGWALFYVYILACLPNKLSQRTTKLLCCENLILNDKNLLKLALLAIHYVKYSKKCL